MTEAARALALEALDIPPMTRFDLYAHLGLVRVMEPRTEVLMRERAQATLEEDDYDSPHSRPWFVSMHGSEFPGVAEDACGRYLAYRMMNFPATEAMPPWVTTTGTLGKAGELDIADAWHQGGGLLAVPEESEDFEQRLRQVAALARAGRTEEAIDWAEKPRYHQLGFVDPEHWMTVSTDLPILPPGWRRPHIVEVKGKADDVLDEMIEGRLLQRPDGTIERVGRGPDKQHINQLKATIGKAHDYDWGRVLVCGKCWFILWSELYERLGLPGGHHPLTDSHNWCPRCKDYEEGQEFELEPPTTGEIYYWSRSWPRKTKSFYYEHDPAFMERGLKVLASVREHFIADEIPPRPEHFQWSVGPCQYCVVPGTLVLKSDLTWSLASKLEIGDELVGFDEHSAGRQRSKYRPAVIQSIDKIRRPRVMVKTSIGYSTCSVEHRFLVMGTQGVREWREAQELKAGDQIIAALGAPWIADGSRDGGYLAGLFDGEGSVAKGHVSVAQVAGPVLDRIQELLRQRGFAFSVDVVSKLAINPCYRVRIKGGLPDQLRLLGMIQPLRLLERSRALWEGASTWSKLTSPAIVEAIDFIGDGEVLAIGTSTSTLITDGLFSHNCSHKPFCRLDFGLPPRARKVRPDMVRTRLTESAGVDHARTIRPGYDPEATRARVLAEWEGTA